MKRKTYTSEEGREILRQIQRIKPFLQGSFTITKKRCGNPKCRCAEEGPIHETALLTWKEGKRTHTLYVPIAYRQEVAEWVEEGKLLRQLIGKMSEEQRNVLRDMKKKKKG